MPLPPGANSRDRWLDLADEARDKTREALANGDRRMAELWDEHERTLLRNAYEDVPHPDAAAPVTGRAPTGTLADLTGPIGNPRADIDPGFSRPLPPGAEDIDPKFIVPLPGGRDVIPDFRTLPAGPEDLVPNFRTLPHHFDDDPQFDLAQVKTGGNGILAVDPSNDARAPNAHDYRKFPAKPLPAPDYEGPVHVLDMYRSLDFEPASDVGVDLWLNDKASLDKARALGERTAREVWEKIKSGNLPMGEAHNDGADAYRHALWNYRMAKELGVEKAKHIADSYERKRPNEEPERLMDLYNNKVGRDLASDPENRNRPDDEVILEALRDGKLRIKPFIIPDIPRGGPNRENYREG